MKWMVDREGTASLNEQIRWSVLSAIRSGDLSPGERLPPARQVAWALRVNVHTVLKAYADLQASGVVEVRRPGGTVVRGDFAELVLEREARLREAARLACDGGVTSGRALEILQEVWK